MIDGCLSLEWKGGWDVSFDVKITTQHSSNRAGFACLLPGHFGSCLHFGVFASFHVTLPPGVFLGLPIKEIETLTFR